MGKKKELENGKATEQLCQYIPSEKLLTLINVYRSIKRVQDEARQITFPIDELRKINMTLKKLQRKGWLSGKGLEKIDDKIRFEIMTSSRGSEVISYGYFKKKKIYYFPDSGNVTERGLPGNITNDAFNILIYALYLLMPKGNPKYALIEDFISEQGITEQGTEERYMIKQQIYNLKKKPELLEERYKYYLDNYFMDVRPNAKGRGLILYCTLPAWEELISKK